MLPAADQIKADVLANLDKPATVIVNALGPQFHRGLEPSRYGRPGRIPGSVNVPAATLVDPATKAIAGPQNSYTVFSTFSAWKPLGP